SPESPAKRITARSSALRDFSTPVAGVAIWPISSCLLARLAQSDPASLAREIRYRGCLPAASGHAPADHWSFYRTRTARARFRVRISCTESSGSASAGVDLVRTLDGVARPQVQDRLREQAREPAYDVAHRHDAERPALAVDQGDRPVARHAHAVDRVRHPIPPPQPPPVCPHPLPHRPLPRLPIPP